MSTRKEVMVRVYDREPGGDWIPQTEELVDSWFLVTVKGWSSTETRHRTGTSQITIKKDDQ